MGDEEGDEEGDDGMDLPEEEETAADKQKKNKKRGRNSEFETGNEKQTKHGTRYASYEDFAHLLEEGLDGEDDGKPKAAKAIIGKNWSAQKKRRTK